MTAARILDVGPTVPLHNDHGTFQITSFRIEDAGTVAAHVALVAGPLHDGDPLRIASACLTSETFGCDRCRCRHQMQETMRRFAEEGRGLLTYHPPEEGRGAGLYDKIRSFAVMDRRGCASEDAFVALGLTADGRTFASAIAIVRHFGLRSVTLLTDSPAKVRALREAGIAVRVEPAPST